MFRIIFFACVCLVVSENYTENSLLLPFCHQCFKRELLFFPWRYAQTKWAAFRAIPGNQWRVRAMMWPIFTVFCAQNGLSMYIIKHIMGSRDQVFLENIAEGQRKTEPDVSFFSKVPCSARIPFTSTMWLIWGRVQVQWSRSFNHQVKEPDCEFSFTQLQMLYLYKIFTT